MAEIFATDLDGVLAINDLNIAGYRPFRKHEWYKKCLPTKYCKLKWDVIITGRRQFFRKITTEWLKSNDVQYKELVMFENKIRRNNRTLSIYKAEKINELNVSLYLEDDERIAQFLIDYCPNTEIVFVQIK